MIVSKTPVRIAFGGGGTDVEPYSTDHSGFVINSTINYYYRSVLSLREDEIIRFFSSDDFTSYEFKQIENLEKELIADDLIKAILYKMKPLIGMDVFLHGEAPKRAGLGASASLSTSLIAGIMKLQKERIELNKIAEKAYRVETEILLNAGGRQDQYAAVYGGFNEIEFYGAENVKIKELKISNSFKNRIEKNLILFYTGEPHVSGSMVEKQIISYLECKKEAKKSLDILKEIAFKIRDSLYSENFEEFGYLLSEDLKEKSKFNPYIITDYMKHLDKIIKKNGGIGGRVCGAGGGGCMVWLVEPNKIKQVKSTLQNQSGKILPYKFVKEGLIIESI